MTAVLDTTTDVIVYRDPKQLTSHPANGRENIGNVDQIAKSIAEVGILQPIILVIAEDGSELILAGHRRVAAAIQADLASVPCILRPDLSGDVASLVSMVIENVHREGLTVIEQAHAYEQLAAFGLSKTAIAKRVGAKQKAVKDGLAVVASELAVAAAKRYSFLTFEHLLAIAEFEDDVEAVKELTVCAKEDPEYFEHAVSGLRRQRERDAAFAQAVEALVESGVTVVDDPGWSHSGPMVLISELVDGNDKELTVKAHAKCAGHVASLATHNPERVTYWCSDPAQYGHTTTRQQWSTSSNSSSSSERGSDGKLTEAARDARRRVIANNKAMEAAIPVRREFVKTLIARKAAPKGMMRYVAWDLANYARLIGAIDQPLVAELVGSEYTQVGYQSVVAPQAVDGATDARLPNVVFAMVAGSIEGAWPKEAWRMNDSRKVLYLNFLKEQGYRLAEVEQEMVDTGSALTEFIESADGFDEEGEEGEE